MKRYLLIDDDEIFNFLHAELIRKAYDSAIIDAFTSSIEGLTYLTDCVNKKEPLPDFLFLDIRMPEMNGFEFLNELLKLPASRIDNIKIFMLTSSLDERDRKTATSYAVVKGFIGKTFSIERLNEIIEEYS
ncbi:MAG TPA: response regulator [Bacteroidia bacterium]|jgi:CheY-like chemotaxis protein|nr:response regulator [Bacteroidia bacterium]